MATRTIGTEIVIAGERKFNDAMKGLNNNLKNLRTGMAVLSAEFDGNEESIESLTRKQSLLSESVDQHRAKVDALNRMYDRQVQLHGENSAGADKYKQQLNQATVAMLKEEKALVKTVAALEQAKAKADGMDKASEEIADAADSVSRSANKAADSLEDMGDEASKSESKLSGAVKGLGSVASAATAASAAVLAAGAAMGGALLTGIVGFAKESAEAAKAAQEAGQVLTESQQKWLAYSGQLEGLEASAASAKSAIAGVLLPVLSDLSTESEKYLSAFSKDMEAAAGDSKKQGQILSQYIVHAVNRIRANLPEYKKLAKELIAGLGEGLDKEGPALFELNQ